ncbi:hypothetical protein LUZ60_010452 [Juncus effusus]|nr:hypothetical protein LUZ60_010452 [Juncus effusus]
MEFTAEEGRSFSVDCPSLLLPALSIGNVGQLAVDLLISSTEAKRVGFLDDSSILPCVGNDAFGPQPEGNLSVSLEAYESASNGLTLIQQRSPFIKGMMIQFARNMANFIKNLGNKKHIIILSSLDFSKKKKFDSSSNIYYISNIGNDGFDPQCENLGYKKLEEYNPDQKRWKHIISLSEGLINDQESQTLIQEYEDENEPLTDFDYFASLPFAALFSFFKAKGFRVTCLMSYCSEGDNISDSFQLADATCKLLDLNPDNFNGKQGAGWKIPLSWQSVYGPPPDTTIY